MADMKATPLFNRHIRVTDESFAELVAWKLPHPVPGKHGYKYRLALVVEGVCVLRYDNEAGKGDHRHVGHREEPYAFSSPRQLMVDFFDEITR